ncbi:MFS transporter [Brevibacillus laterosporus]|uniref:MFS transporter n=1 Tax=Brevibacillus laterosporus TaxID=1465 RepID=UPI002651D3B7|nr:MFS transporter [Brevibacillus laterosporus]MDN9010565.1 MFS transporter [Brevibacillus laterosporus]MDO0941526.1 MFS transporter [Brevibacillus laterosporus]
MKSSRFTFTTLLVVVFIAGITQGLTLPLLAILLEERGISAVSNGLNAAALYVGMFIMSPLMEIFLRKWGYRTCLFIGLVLVTFSTLLLPLFTSLSVWFVLRLIMGMGDSALHYTSQIWVTATSTPERRGRDLSLYGLSYGAGFSVGPLAINLMPFGLWAPFMALVACNLVAFFMLLQIRNAYPPEVKANGGKKVVKSREKYKMVIQMTWLALIPAFLYGFMETTLNGSFPIAALRTGISAESVSIILPSFVVGSLFLQLPLGTLSDRVGRKKVMMCCAVIGCIAFMLFPLATSSVPLMMLLLASAGAAVGSFYSLGLAYCADILPQGLIPIAGIIASMNFSVASIITPSVNGFLINYISPTSIFVAMGVMFIVFFLAAIFFRPEKARTTSVQEFEGVEMK